MCREKSVGASSGAGCSGSPLRVQGKVIMYHKGRDGVRITPACAGKSESIVVKLAVI